MGEFAWVTLSTNDSYSLGALVLAHSLRRVDTKHDLAVLVTPGVTEPMREKLASVFNLVREVNVVDSKDEANLAVLQRPELGITFTKLHCWRLTEYKKCVFIDADALVVKNSDELFDREELSAAPDVGWPDCFNSGVFVFRPSQETFASLTAFAVSQGSFDGADQGLLNSYFSDWAYKDISKHLPFIYNMCSTATYSYAPAFKQFGENVKIIHFIGTTKPWLQYFDTITGIVQPPPGCSHLQPLLQLWWNIFCDNVHSKLTDVMGGLAGALSKLTLGESRSDEQQAIESHMRKQNWEQGHIDFMGQDSFDNILKKINETISTAPKRQPSPAKETQQSQKSGGESSEVEAALDENKVASLETEDRAEPTTNQESSETVGQNIINLEATSSLLSKEQQPKELLQDISKTDLQPTDFEKTFHTKQNTDILVSEVQLHIQPEENSTDSEVNLPEVLDDKQTVDTTAVNFETKEEKIIKSASDPLADTISVQSSIPSTPAEKLEEQNTAQVVSEATTECPVPIQVAESVLQAEQKESVSEDAKPIDEVVASSITPSINESVTVVSETLIEPVSSALTSPLINSEQLNKDDPQIELETVRDTAEVTSTALITRSPNIVSVVHEFDPRTTQEQQINQESQQLVGQVEIEIAEKSLEEMRTSVPVETSESTDSQKTKLTVVLPLSDGSEKITGELEPKNIQIGETSILSEAEPPSRPNRSKDLKIPSTPIIIGPTPPTSPPLETESTQEANKEVQVEAEHSEKAKDLEEASQIKEDQCSASTETTVDTQKYNEPEKFSDALSEVPPEKSSEPQTEVEPEKCLETQQTEKKFKKMVKKSSAESDTPSSPESEGSGKKIVKKVVKKVKSKDGESAEGSTNSEKSKKIKTIKKVSKTLSSSSLEADKTVPETPPPSASSEIPVPPKRKSKSSSSLKSADKKPEES